MTKAIIFARTASQRSNIDTKINKLKNYCRDNKLSIVKAYAICANRKNTYYIKNLYQDIKAIPDKHINLIVYSIKNFLPNIETLELFDNLVKAEKVSLHFCKDNLIYNSQTPVSEIARLNMATLAYQYHNIHFVPKDKLQYIADKIYITQMQENIKANILKNQ